MIKTSKIIYAGPADSVRLEAANGLSVAPGQDPTSRIDHEVAAEKSVLVVEMGGYSESEYHFLIRLIGMFPALAIPAVPVEKMDAFAALQASFFSLVSDGRITGEDIPEVMRILSAMVVLVKK